MGRESIKYHFSPSVVRANSSQVFTVIGLDESSRFYDDCEYFVRVLGLDDYNFRKDRSFPGNEKFPDFPCKCENGVITFEYYFEGEQEWSIQIFRKENEKHRNPMYDFHPVIWKHLIDAPLKGVTFRVYSLEEDLYNRIPLKGDMHIHTGHTDGEESPEMSAAMYRKQGFDFIGITDHHTIQPSLQAIEKFKDIPTTFKLYPGEEIHNGYGGYFHMVNFNCRDSICARILNDREQVEREIDAVEAAIEVPDNLDRREMAWRTWFNDEIHRVGGISILPHPYSIIGGVHNTQGKVCKYMFEHNLCDVFEVVGGTSAPANRRNHAALYIEARGNGIDMPVVGSSDCHTATKPGFSGFDDAWTIVFAQNRDTVPEDVLNHYSVAVDNQNPASKIVYGHQRLTQYAWFLIDNYYKVHDALCEDIGRAVLRRVFGDKTQDPLIVLLEAELEKYNKSFFGK